MAQSVDAQVGVTPLPRRTARFGLAADGGETRVAAPGFDVFRLIVALTGLAAFLALPMAVIAGVALLLR